MFARAGAVVILIVVLLLAAAAGPASATPAYKLYASMSTVADAAGGAQGHVEGYALDATDPLNAWPDTIEVTVARAGVDQATASGQGYAQLGAFTLQAGDEVTVTDVDTGDAHTVTYSGQPTLDVSALCAAGAKFSGRRDEGKDVSVSGTSASGAVGAVKVATGPGTTFAGGFTTTLTSSWTIRAQETLMKSDAFSAYADVSRAALDCPPPVAEDPAPVVTTPAPVVTTPAPVAAAPAPRDVIAPLASLTVRVSRAWHALVGGTFSDAVTITEPGTVKQVLYADGGARTAKAKVLGSGRAVVTKAGKVTVKVKLSKKGKAHVKARKSLKVRLVTTVVDRAGNARVLAPKRFTVKRGR